MESHQVELAWGLCHACKKGFVHTQTHIVEHTLPTCSKNIWKRLLCANYLALEQSIEARSVENDMWVVTKMLPFLLLDEISLCNFS